GSTCNLIDREPEHPVPAFRGRANSSWPSHTPSLGGEKLHHRRHYFVAGFFRAFDAGETFHIRRQGSFVGVIYARKTVDHADAGLVVETLRIAFLAYRQRRI